MKKLTTSLFAGLICILFATSTHAQNSDQARNFQINETHTGSSSSPGLVPPLLQKWSVNFGQPISYPLIADGKVFVTVKNTSSYGTRLYALSATDGSSLWSYDLAGSFFWSGLCYESGRVFAINWNGLLRAFDGPTGSLLWSRQLGSSITSSPTVLNGVIYTASGTGTAYAVSAASGTVLWTAPVTGGEESSPAVTNEGVYVSYSSPNVFKLDPTNGALIWRTPPAGSGGGGRTPALYQGRLYVRNGNPDLIYDSQTGALAGSFISKSVPAFSGGLGFFLNGPRTFFTYGVVEARDVNSNIVQWSFSGDGHLQSSIIVVNNYVYVGSDLGKLFAIDAATGNQVWSTTAGTNIPFVDEQNLSQPVTGFAAGEGILVVPTDTTLVAYNGGGPPTITWDFQAPAANADGWNNTPVQFYFTPHAHPDGTVSSTPVSPLQFNSQGSNQTQQVVVTDSTHNTTATYDSPAVNIDFTAPVTTESFSGTRFGGVTMYHGPGQYTLTGSDALSGVRNVFYVWDNGSVAQTYTGPISISTEGQHTLHYWSEDVAGNREWAQSDFFVLDATPPTTQASVSGNSADGWCANPAQVSLSATDDSIGVASTGVAHTYFTIDGGSTQTYANPFNVAGEGNHTISYWSVDHVGNVESAHSLTVKIDASAPTVQLSVTGTAGTNGWYVSPSVQVELVVTDSLSGVAATYYGVDGGMTQTYAGPFTLNGSAQHQINIAAVDKVSNLTEQSRTVKIDNVAPTTQSSVSGSSSNGYYNGPAQVSLTASDNLSGVANTYYRIDGGATQTYSQAFNVSGDGAHAVAFWSVDMAGNTANANTINLSVDATAPTTQASLAGTAGGGGWYTTPVQVTFSANDNFSGVANTSYSIDGGALQSYSTPFTISDAGTHTITFSSKDQANNSEPQQSMIIKIDMSPPTTQAALSGTTGNDGWYITPVQVTLSATDSVSGVANTSYAIDGGALQTYATPFTISDTGTHTITFSSKDQANNSEAQQSTTVKIDASAPSTQAAVSGNSSNGWYQNPAQVSLTASDAASGVANSFYTIDGGAAQTYAASFNVSGDGSHVVNYWSVDTAGNTEAQQSVTVHIDTTSPSTQISASGTSGDNGWYRGPVQVSLAGADSQSGLANTFYSIDGGPTQTYATPFSISGDGQHTLNFWSVDRLSNSETHQTATIKIDHAGPTTQSSVSGPAGGGSYYLGAVQMSLTAADNTSGIAAIYYRIDGGATQTYSAAFSISGDGTHSIDYWSVDVAGNNQYSYTATVRIDATPPATAATPSGTVGTNGWYRSAVAVALGASDNASGVQGIFYKIDGGALLTYTTPFTVSTAGMHTVNYWSVDVAGNTEAQHPLTLKIDSSTPVITESVSPTQAGHGNKPLTVKISGTVTDTPSGVLTNGSVSYSVLDEYGVTQPSGGVTLQSNGTYSFTLSLPATKNQGDNNGHLYTITIQAVDQAGNVATASATVKIT